MNPYAEAHAPQTCLSANSSTLASCFFMCRIQLYYYSRKTSPCQHLKSLILFIFRKYSVNPGENSIFSTAHAKRQTLPERSVQSLPMKSFTPVPFLPITASLPRLLRSALRSGGFPAGLPVHHSDPEIPFSDHSTWSLLRSRRKTVQSFHQSRRPARRPPA